MPRLATAPFETWTYADAQKALKDQLPADYTVKAAYAAHDHFQKGTEWVGPGDATVNESIKKQFAPEDAIGEVLSNVENAFGEPQLGSVPKTEMLEGQAIPEATQRRMREVVSLLTQWWDKRRLQEHIQDRQRTGAWAGYAGLRLWVPWRFLDQAEGGVVTIRSTEDLAEALSYVHVGAPAPDKGAIVTDNSTQDKCAVFLDEEVIYTDGKKETFPRAELVYLDPNRETDEDAKTIVRVVYSDPERKKDVRTELELGGNLLFAEIRARAVITEPVMRTQRQLNLLNTLVTHMAETAAFRERYTKNAKPQGTRTSYVEGDPIPDGAYLERDEEGREWLVVPQPRTLGANTTTELVGLPRYDDHANAVGHETPDVFIADPVDPRPYIEAGDASRRRILRMCSQGHLGGISNAEASGIAYEQNRAVFEKDLNKRRVSEEGMLLDLLTALLHLVERITGKEGYFTDVLRLTISQHVNAGPRSPDLVRLDIEAYEKGAMSKETLMAKIGIEDIDGELSRVRGSVAHILTVLEKIAGTSQMFEPESLLAALKELGLPPEIVGKLVAKPTVVTTGANPEEQEDQ